MTNNTFELELQLFADGGAGAAGGDGGAVAGAEAATGVNVPAAEGRKQKKRENPLANVKYGIQPESAQQAAPAQEDTANTDQPEEDFESLIKGKYKADFDARVQGIIRERFKSNTENEDKLAKMQPLLEMLGQKHNIDPTDIDQLTKVIGDDDSLYEEEAMERGISVETLKTIKQMERENEQLRAREQRSIAEQRMQEHFNKLAQQAEQVKRIYGNFDLMTEMKNPAFARLTAPGVGFDVQTAYEMAHYKELRDSAVRQTAQQTAENMSKAIQSGSKRPTENGLNGQQGASTIKTDPRTLTRADVAEIKARVARGEKIVF